MPYSLQHTRDVPNLSYNCDLITTFIGFGLFFEMCLIDLVASFSHAKLPPKTPLTGLSRTPSNTYFLLHYYYEQNKTARSEIYQRHLHLNLPLDQSVVTQFKYFLRHNTLTQLKNSYLAYS